MGMLEGQVALITGGSRGQGRAHALTCAREGADVVIFDLTKQALQVDYPLATAEDHAETVRQIEALGGRVIAVDGDVRDQSALDGAVGRAIAEFGKVDILIANAGIWTNSPFWEMSEQQWGETVEVNFSGVWRSAKAVAPHMIERKSGSIVIISSVGGEEPGRNCAHYSATKHGVLGLMKNIALELGPYGVRCNAINPGAVRTPMTNHQRAWDLYAGHPNGTEADLLDAGYNYGILRGRTFMDPQAIADTALYLNSAMAENVTGVTIPVDAGHMLLLKRNMNPIKE